MTPELILFLTLLLCNAVMSIAMVLLARSFYAAAVELLQRVQRSEMNHEPPPVVNPAYFEVGSGRSFAGRV